MTKCAIMQPTYLPWSGYFNLISSVDKFIFLDCVQFDKRSWQSRNRVCINGVEKMLSVPTCKSSQGTIILDIEISDHNDWRSQHLEALERAYNKAPFGKKLILALRSAYLDRDHRSLSSMNISIITALSSYLGIEETEFLLASELGCNGRRSELLANLCSLVNCEVYLAPLGSKEYLIEDQFDAMSTAELRFQDYAPQSYEQVKSDVFISHLSVIDVIANIGPNAAREYCVGT